VICKRAIAGLKWATIDALKMPHFRSLGSQPKEARHRLSIHLRRRGRNHFPEADSQKPTSRQWEDFTLTRDYNPYAPIAELFW
jgi:hypothetical protein